MTGRTSVRDGASPRRSTRCSTRRRGSLKSRPSGPARVLRRPARPGAASTTRPVQARIAAARAATRGDGDHERRPRNAGRPTRAAAGAPERVPAAPRSVAMDADDRRVMARGPRRCAATRVTRSRCGSTKEDEHERGRNVAHDASSAASSAARRARAGPLVPASHETHELPARSPAARRGLGQRKPGDGLLGGDPAPRSCTRWLVT